MNTLPQNPPEGKLKTTNFWVLIPPAIYSDESLPDKAKFLYGRILALIDEKGYCDFSNRFFAEQLGLTIQTISSYISHLEAAGYLRRKIIYGENKQIVDRQLFPLII